MDVLLNEIDNDASLLSLKRQVERELALAVDPGHDLSHMLRVAIWTLRLDTTVRRKNAIAAALLHDFVNPPKNDIAKNKRASELSAARARELLLELGESEFSAADVEEICDAIHDHSFSSGAVPRSDLGRALQDADRLEALGVLGMFRNISCGTRMGASFFHPSDPWNKTDRALDDKRYSMDHYAIKLFKLEHTMCTELGRAEAAKRSARMRRILQEFAEEILFDQ